MVSGQLLSLTQGIAEKILMNWQHKAMLLLLYTMVILVLTIPFTILCFYLDDTIGYAKTKFGGW